MERISNSFIKTLLTNVPRETIPKNNHLYWHQNREACLNKACLKTIDRQGFKKIMVFKKPPKQLLKHT